MVKSNKTNKIKKTIRAIQDHEFWTWDNPIMLVLIMIVAAIVINFIPL